MTRKIFTFRFRVDGIEKSYLIPSNTLFDALVRLGQIYGDKEGKEDRVIEVLEVM